MHYSWSPPCNGAVINLQQNASQTRQDWYGCLTLLNYDTLLSPGKCRLRCYVTAHVKQHSVDMSGGSHVYALLWCHIRVTFSFTQGGDNEQLHLNLQLNVFVCIHFYNCYLLNDILWNCMHSVFSCPLLHCWWLSQTLYSDVHFLHVIICCEMEKHVASFVLWKWLLLPIVAAFCLSVFVFGYVTLLESLISIWLAIRHRANLMKQHAKCVVCFLLIKKTYFVHLKAKRHYGQHLAHNINELKEHHARVLVQKCKMEEHSKQN